MQNRMKLSFDGKRTDGRTDKRDFSYKEKPHPPSTASDTDTNSESDAKTFKKPIGNPFTSARLNRAFRYVFSLEYPFLTCTFDMLPNIWKFRNI